MICPNAKINKGIMLQLQVAMDRVAGRPTTYKPKDRVYCKSYKNECIAESFADKYCRSDKYKDCKGCNGFVVPDFENLNF